MAGDAERFRIGELERPVETAPEQDTDDEGRNQRSEAERAETASSFVVLIHCQLLGSLPPTLHRREGVFHERSCIGLRDVALIAEVAACRDIGQLRPFAVTEVGDADSGCMHLGSAIPGVAIEAFVEIE